MMDISSLKPYHGYQSSIIPLTSGYYIYLASWDKTPTEFSHFTNVWLITPEDERVLFADPPASSPIVCLYHEFHEIYGATITLDWISKNQLNVQCKSLDDRYNLNIDFQLEETWASRLLVSLGGGPPTNFRLSKPMLAVSNFLLNILVAKKGSHLLGDTETGQPFYHGDTEKLFSVTGGSMSLNGDDIGTFTHPTWRVEFGDAVPYYNPVLKLGTLFIPFEQNMLEKDA
ncbi:MAG: hypothetical protein P8046_00735 [Anaerolineales bacterium]